MQEVQNRSSVLITNESKSTKTQQSTGDGIFQSLLNNQTNSDNLSTNKDSTQTDESILTSYTKTNTAVPQNTEVQNKLFASIIEDNTISYEEIENLTYEEVTELANYYMQKNDDGEFIPNPRINVERKAGMLISSTAITENTSFNKAVFYSIQKIEDEDFLETFMFDITGTQFSDKIIAYPELQTVKFDEGFSRFITKKIASYQVKLDNAATQEEKENYQTLVDTFTRLDHMNKSFNNQSIHEKEDNIIERMKALVENIVSIIKTGFTLEELEYIEKLLAEIRKRIKESQEHGTNNEEEISTMMKQLERAVAELQKRVTGVTVIETEDDSLQNSDEPNTNTDSLNFEARLDAMQKTIEKMKSGQLLETEITTEKSEEEKEEDKKW